MFSKVIVANRGAVAARVLRALRQLGVRSVAVYSEADAHLPYLAQADESYCLGAPEPQASYLNQDKLLDVLARSGADGLHPGYGFLSENAGFAERVNATGATFIGPSPRWIDAMGHKTRARDLMARHGMPMARSSGLLADDMDEALRAAERIGFPVLVKPATGGGGIGMLAAHSPEELRVAVERARTLAARSFGNAELYLEELMLSPRHIEFQVLADRQGHIRHLFERDCSVQRRHQKLIEESPAPLIPRAAILKAADRMTEILHTLRYDVIGTVETLYGAADAFQFLEMNTRLQVEHAVTEEITGIDLVVSQIRLAAGEPLASVLPADIAVRGHAIEVRIYAEDPVRFFPSPGTLRTLRFPSGPGLRVETGYAEGSVVTPWYDPLIAKLIVHAEHREAAIDRLVEAIDATEIAGVKNNLPFLRRMLMSAPFRSGHVHTGLAAQVLQGSAA
ncbi:acetyl-CoA carboxylase biotin carboxylase subunit [Variovorax sp. PBL-E5]|uniref:acetyl-CoA carboxylase biotin carboxylase subunit n=1 Tax=Variovorax sp. PBL-E5 TaxID=434014 RepID=UPI001315B20A|nr:biotin carboxylase N-terminal domain-containing protein [Variovorax sp. PBL-E5]VTU45540.1 Acetyl-/propionyl-coenzyme A carboxylase alpha chain [Variovorax sp. PBL-E5]